MNTLAMAWLAMRYEAEPGLLYAGAFALDLAALSVAGQILAGCPA